MGLKILHARSARLLICADVRTKGRKGPTLKSKRAINIYRGRKEPVPVALQYPCVHFAP
jgi:hypothetical protein